MSSYTTSIAFGLLVLTSPDGRPITLDLSSGLVIVPLTSEAHCARGSNAVVTFGNKSICVRETSEQIRNKIDESSHQ